MDERSTERNTGDGGGGTGVYPYVERETMSETDGSTFDALADSREWLQALARGLLGSSPDTDDLVQDTLLVGLEKPPRDPRFVRTWLSRVLRSRISLERRSKRRRARRESRVARPETLPSDRELLERLETQRAVSDAVRDLDEPYRRTVLLRYVEDLSPEEIAKRLAVPASTVRSRLHRAHDRLRRRLDKEFGGRAAWAIALLPHLHREQVAAAGLSLGSVTEGIMLMKKAATVAAALGVIGLFYFLVPTEWWRDGPVAGDSSTGSVALETGANQDEPARETQSSFSSPQPGASDAIAGGVEPLESAPVELPSQAEDTTQKSVAIVRGRVWLADGGSLEGSRVFLWGGERPGSLVDAEGAFRIEAPWEMATSLYLEYEGQKMALGAEVRLVFGDEAVLEIEVEQGHGIDLELVSKESGDPVPDAELMLQRRNHRGQAAAVMTKTDADGRVSYHLLPEAPYTITVNIDGYTPLEFALTVPSPHPVRVELTPARPLEITLVNFDHYPEIETVYVQLIEQPRFVPGQTTSTASHNIIARGKPDDANVLHIKAPPPGVWGYHVFGARSFPRIEGKLFVPEGTDVVRHVATLPPRGQATVVGTLHDEHGDAVVGGFLKIEEQSAPVRGGAFELSGVRPGRHEIVYKSAQGNHRIEYKLGQHDVREDQENELALTVPGKGRVMVTVEGLPESLFARDLFLRLTPEESNRALLWAVQSPHQDILFAYVPAGRYRLTVTSENAPLGTRVVDVYDDREARETFEFQGTARLQFDLRSSSQAPLPPQVFISLKKPYRHERLEVADGRASMEFYTEIDTEVELTAVGFETHRFRLRASPGHDSVEVITLTSQP